MLSPVIEFENLTNPATYQIKAAKWKVYRKYVRVRYDYVNGGTDFFYRSYKLLFEFEWPYLSQTAHNNLKSVIEALARGDTVRINSIGGQTYQVNIVQDTDDFTETEGEFLEKRPIKVRFISKDAQTIS